MVFFIYMGGGAQGMALSAGLLVLSLVLVGGTTRSNTSTALSSQPRRVS